jgi:hypothetical protein
MSQLEEAGAEDLCSLMNQVMCLQPHFGSGGDLAEYLEALTALERQGELRVRMYWVEQGRTIYGDVVTSEIPECRAAFQFDPADRIWRWTATARQLVEVPDG